LKLLLTHDIHAVEVQGRFYNPAGVIDYGALDNYRFAIKDLLVVLRCRKGSEVGAGWLRIDGEGIEVHPIPDMDFNRPLRVLAAIPGAIKEGLRAIKSCDRYVVRLPGPGGALMALLLRLKRKKYGVEFVGDPGGMFEVSDNLVKHQWLYRWFHARLYKYLVKKAFCVAYRSEFLRRRYPCGRREHEWVFSGLQLSDGAIGAPRQASWFEKSPFRMMFVGRVTEEKGVMHLLEAFAEMYKASSRPTELHFVGDGKYLGQLKAAAGRLKVEEAVRFHGRVPRGPGLFALLDEAHCFVLPTYMEGMPRSLIEAMARGVPCFASDIEAVAEVLDRDLLFAVRSSEAIVEKVGPFLDDPAGLAEVSRRCFERSKRHWPEVLAVAKEGFWNDVVEHCK